MLRENQKMYIQFNFPVIHPTFHPKTLNNMTHVMSISSIQHQPQQTHHHTCQFSNSKTSLQKYFCIFHSVNSIRISIHNNKVTKKCVEFANHKAFPSRALVRQMSEKICCLLKHISEICMYVCTYMSKNKIQQFKLLWNKRKKSRVVFSFHVKKGDMRALRRNIYRYIEFN